jgi:APA family basic amino acid/polyamine antiporter
MTAPRMYFAQARDGLFFHKLAEIHPRFEAPSFSILVQGAWAMILAVSGSYEVLFTYVMFISWVVHAMCVVAVIVLRRKHPDAARPYRMWGYPATALLFVAFAAWFVVNTLLERPVTSLMGLALIAAGIPVYQLWRRKRKESITPL